MENPVNKLFLGIEEEITKMLRNEFVLSLEIVSNEVLSYGTFYQRKLLLDILEKATENLKSRMKESIE